MRKMLSKKATVILLPLFALLAVSLVFLRFYTSSLSFTYYEPTYLPHNMSITDKEIEIGSSEGSGHELAVLYFENGENLRNTIVQSKVKADNILETMLKYDASGRCEIRTTPNAQEYFSCVNEVENRILIQEITFIKNGTAHGTRLPSNKTDSIGRDQVEKFIDSFEHRSTFGIRVKRTNFGGRILKTSALMINKIEPHNNSILLIPIMVQRTL